MVDGYTTTDLYPYSQRLSLAQATSTSYAPGGSVAGQPADQVNYIRNSVKAVVNAYTGAVTLYQWDAADPILRDLEEGVSRRSSSRRRDIPGDLLQHLRYPPDLFEVQRQILAQYHVHAGAVVLRRAELLGRAQRPGAPTQQVSQPPYYLTMTMPGAPRGVLADHLAGPARPRRTWPPTWR